MKPTLRLFQILDTQSPSKQPLDNKYYSNWKLAKKTKSILNDDWGSVRYIVSPGPDHKHYKEHI